MKTKTKPIQRHFATHPKAHAWLLRLGCYVVEGYRGTKPNILHRKSGRWVGHFEPWTNGSVAVRLWRP